MVHGVGERKGGSGKGLEPDVGRTQGMERHVAQDTARRNSWRERLRPPGRDRAFRGDAGSL
eukprot:1854494-Lingulodinium_polyedra.AAC.1